MSVGVAIGLVLGIGGTLTVSSIDFYGARSPFEGALEACDLTDRPTAVLGDDGRSLDLDHRGEGDAAGLTTDQLHCVLDELEAPDRVISRMQRTRALDGHQTDEWSGVEASWIYHPDTGLDVLLTLL
ncbi:hypothetical protein A6A08_07600 [Nocardiopsis sp. TSRI0078]|uniref:hypothetical protein n=1 Tax=unclassified Nocardiopsis TaxID=2649073 RepID=UPI00095BAAD7|nr:hypothetical protein [Nocardiopsis sp. TSRI0078]OKI17111.1 hypothetical protein A6A08_07600 [Nocardiopsis sp. TSRI0078]